MEIKADFWGDVAKLVIGSIPTVAAVFIYLSRIDRKMTVFLVEHEMLIAWYAQEHHIKPEDLPTRVKRRFTDSL
jgi:hypothetical protein